MHVAATVRIAGPEDSEAIAALHADSWRRTYRGILSDAFLDGDVFSERRLFWQRRLEDPASNQHVSVVECASGIGGFVCVRADDDPTWGGLIDNLHVAHDLHRRGFGRRLMHEAAAWLYRVQHGGGAYLWVYEANGNARAFYDRLGAVHVDTVLNDLVGGGQAPGCRYAWPQVDRLLMATQSPMDEKL